MKFKTVAVAISRWSGRGRDCAYLLLVLQYREKFRLLLFDFIPETGADGATKAELPPPRFVGNR